MTTACQVHGLAASRAIEGFGDWRTPVNNDRLTLFIGHRESPNMKTFELVIFETIDTTEYQSRITKIKIGQSFHQRIVDGIALKTILKGSTHSSLGMTAQFQGVFATPHEAVIGMIDICLFVIKIWVLSGHKGLISLAVVE
jgi:hypothetical protein